MTKYEQIAEHVIVTFFEAAGAYLIVIPTVNWSRTVVAGAIGAGLSAVYNVVRQAYPTIPDVAPSQPTVVSPVVPSTPVIETPVSEGQGTSVDIPVTSVEEPVPPEVPQQ